MTERGTGKHGKPSGRDYCSTSEAARMLGVSLGTVQHMAENGLLDSWRTAGGHRRIRIGSIESYLHRRHMSSATSDERLHVLIAESDFTSRELYAHTLAEWNLPINAIILASGFDSLLEIGREIPDLLIFDLAMPGLDSLIMMHELRSNPRLEEMDMVAIAGPSPQDIERTENLPASVIVYRKPVPFGELKGYIQAKLVQLQKRIHGVA